jgi:hypothetical protein
MFGLFSAKPDMATQKMYTEQAEKAAMFCMHLRQFKSCPPKLGEGAISLDEEANKKELITAITDFIDLNDLSNGDHNAVTDAIINSQSSGGDQSSASSSARAVISVLNMVNLLAKQYSDLYPNSKSMLKMVNQLAKICPGGMLVIFGDDPPIQVQRAFPHFSSMFEHNRFYPELDYKRA